jgi:hypothetical protein
MYKKQCVVLPLHQIQHEYGGGGIIKTSNQNSPLSEVGLCMTELELPIIKIPGSIMLEPS